MLKLILIFILIALRVVALLTWIARVVLLLGWIATLALLLCAIGYVTIKGVRYIHPRLNRNTFLLPTGLSFAAACIITGIIWASRFVLLNMQQNVEIPFTAFLGGFITPMWIALLINFRDNVFRLRSLMLVTCFWPSIQVIGLLMALNPWLTHSSCALACILGVGSNLVWLLSTAYHVYLPKQFTI